MDGTELRASLRKLLETDIRLLIEQGHVPQHGERELRIRIGGDGFIRWFESTRVRAPASELEDGQTNRPRSSR